MKVQLLHTNIPVGGTWNPVHSLEQELNLRPINTQGSSILKSYPDNSKDFMVLFRESEERFGRALASILPLHLQPEELRFYIMNLYIINKERFHYSILTKNHCKTLLFNCLWGVFLAHTNSKKVQIYRAKNPESNNRGKTNRILINWTFKKKNKPYKQLLNQ